MKTSTAVNKTEPDAQRETSNGTDVLILATSLIEGGLGTR